MRLKQVRRALAVLSIVVAPAQGAVVADDSGASLASQLRDMQVSRVAEQKSLLDAQDQELLSKEILMAEGDLVARGTITVVTDKTDPRTFPYGLECADVLDAKFSSPSSRLYLLVVGRDSTQPLAAKSLPLANLKFPLVYEVETKDLLFPWNREAWVASPNHLDTVAVSAFFTPEESLSRPNPSIRVGFALSEPKQFAGKVTRSNADIKLGTGEPIDTRLFNANEIAILEQVDSGILKNSGGKR